MAPYSIIIASCTVTAALLIYYGYLYISEKKRYILFWMMSLALLMIAYISRYCILDTAREHTILCILNFIATIAGYWLITNGTRVFLKGKTSHLSNIGAVLLIVLFTVFTLLGLPINIIVILSMAYVIFLLGRTAYICLTAKNPKSILRYVLGCTFIAWSVSIFLYPLCYFWNFILQPMGYVVVGIIGLIAYIGIQGLYFQSIREELEDNEAKIRNLMAFDKLTGAYSRAYFEHTLDDFLGKLASPVILAMGDLNGLKLINDTFGHGKGDELLLDGVNIMKKSLGEENIIIRWGGDEFIIIMPNVTMLEAEASIKKVKTNLKLFRPKTIPLEISFGLTLFDHKEQSIYECIKHAEELMYNCKLHESKMTRFKTIEFLEKLLWEKDYQTETHVMRIKSLAGKIGQRIGLSSRELAELNQVAMLHDIGKIGVPGEVLKKRTELTPEEWMIMKKHTEIGYRITQSTRELSYISDAILSHHEWWDGSGYPQNLKGQEIPLYSRIVAIVDSYDVMTHERPYKRAIDSDTALKEINACAGTQFDPYLVEIFNSFMQEALVANDY